MTLPRMSQGDIHIDKFLQHLRLLIAAGIEGVVLNGATGEYCLTSSSELYTLVQQARQAAGEGFRIAAAIGAPSLAQTLQRLEAAESAGANALLLPMPSFFPYQQQDLEEYAREVVQHASRPVLLYNLPEFTTPIEPGTTLALLRSEPGVAGIKDSSGQLDTLRLLTENGLRCNRIVGNDAALYASVAEDVCDGVVSGVASVLPEFMLAYYAALRVDVRGAEAIRFKESLDGLIDWLGKFPVPWGLKVIAEARDFYPADFALPLSEQREKDVELFRAWIDVHRKDLCLTADGSAQQTVAMKEMP